MFITGRHLSRRAVLKGLGMSPKKIKELPQERHITGEERKLWPVVVSGDEIVWVRGFPGPAGFRPHEESGEAVLIREVPLED